MERQGHLNRMRFPLNRMLCVNIFLPVKLSRCCCPCQLLHVFTQVVKRDNDNNECRE